MAKCTTCGQADEAYSAVPVAEGTAATCTECAEKKAKLYYNPSSKCVPVYNALPCRRCSCSPCACDACDSPVNYNNPACMIPQAPKPCKPIAKDVFARVDQAFNVPDVGYSAQVRISNVNLSDGQPLTHPNYGTFSVHPAFSSDPEIYNLENKAELQNDIALVGKPVNCGEEFYLGYAQPEPVGDLSFGCNHLLTDFFIPAISATANAQVESFTGFSIGSNVIIRSKATPSDAHTFKLSATSGTDILILENEGDGGTPNSVLKADANSDGEYDWCVEPLTQLNACGQASDTQCIAHILGCDENGNMRKIEGVSENEALVWDAEQECYTNRLIPKTIKCVSLITCFQIPITADACDRQTYVIQTSDDQALLDEALDVLLSDNAEPKVTICDYVFSLNLNDSVVGAIVVTPIFNNEEIVNFDNNCRVCIPEDCCFQCNPQVQYPIEVTFPPGHSTATAWSMPNNLMQAADGEYKFSFVKTPDGITNLTFYHDPATNAILSAYNESGIEVDLADFPGYADYTYETFDYCRTDDSCPVDGQFESDINVRFTNLADEMEINFLYFGEVDVYPCDLVGVEGQQLTTTQFCIMKYFKGPTFVSTIAVGTDPWGVPSLAGQLKPMDAQSGYNKRTFTLFYPTCVRVRIIPRVLVHVGSVLPTADDFTYGSVESVSMFRTQLI